MAADLQPLAVDGGWTLTPRQHTDDRGTFLEWFRQDLLEHVLGHPLHLAQANASVSARGVVRGVHYADVPPGQAKWVTCTTGAVLDVVVDLRTGSPTFGTWDSVLLDTEHRRAVYLAEGLGHAFMSLADGSTVTYLCSTGYAPDREHGVDPFDPTLAIDWPTHDLAGMPLQPLVSDKDAAAPTLAAAEAAGALPTLDSTRQLLEQARRRAGSAGSAG